MNRARAQDAPSPEASDPRRVVRGMVVGLAIAAMMWLVLGAAIWWLLA